MEHIQLFNAGENISRVPMQLSDHENDPETRSRKIYAEKEKTSWNRSKDVRRAPIRLELHKRRLKQASIHLRKASIRP